MNTETVEAPLIAPLPRPASPAASTSAQFAAQGVDYDTIADAAARWFSGLQSRSPELAHSHAERLCERLVGLNQRFAVALIEGRTVVLDMHSIEPRPVDGKVVLPRALPSVMDTSALTKLYAETTIPTHGKRERHRNLAELWLEWPGRRKYDHGWLFAPGDARRDLPGGRLNLFRGWGINPDGYGSMAENEAGCSHLLYHLRNVVCGSDELVYRWLLWWCADIVQNPREKPGSAVVLAGRKGSGKTLVAEVLREVIGQAHFVRVASKRDVVGEFNAHLATALVVNIEEAMFGGDVEANDTLKDLVTSDTILVNEKFLPRQTVKSYGRFIFTTNSSYSHSTSEDERRYLFLDVQGTYVGDRTYFDRLHAQLEMGGYEAFANLLHGLSKPDGVDLRRPPRTEAHSRLFAESLSVEERFFFNALVDGEDYPSPKDGYVAVKGIKAAFDAYLSEQGQHRSYARSDNGFVPRMMAKFWGVDPESRTRRGVARDACYEIQPLRDARERATLPVSQGGLGLLPSAVGLDDDE